jgi:hydrogenase-4 component F
VFAIFCLLITISFVATGRTIFPTIWGEATHHPTWPRQTFLAAFPKILFLLALVVLGLYVPPVVQALLQSVADSLGVP